MSDIFLSVVCPVYNCADYLEELVEGVVRNANARQIEWLFVHDCATDGSEEILKASLAARADDLVCDVRHVCHAVNRGLAAARNSGIDAARGQYVAFLDSDDLPLLGYADQILGALQSRSPMVLEVGFREFAQARELQVHNSVGAPVPVVRLSDGQHFRLLFDNQFFAWTRIVRRDLLERVRFAEDGKAYEDIPYTMALFCEAGEVVFLDAPLIGYRKRPGSITSIRDHRFLDQYSQLVKAVRHYRGHPAVVRHQQFEWRLLKKLWILLLKGMRIRPMAARKAFYRAVAADLRQAANPFPRATSGITRLLVRLLSASTEVFQKAA